MSLIFDSFPSIEAARGFVALVKGRTGLEGQTFLTDAESQAHDWFPDVLSPPIVHIDRRIGDPVEEFVSEAVEEFGGVYVGT